jgi:uncharacterized phiE125 gp8 family phage protein
MWYSPKTTTPVSVEPITLAQAKAQVRVQGTEDDTFIERLITTARDHVEKVCGQYFATRTIEVYCDSFCDLARIETVPVSEDVVISYQDIDGAPQDVDEDLYELRADGLDAALVLKAGQSWPAKQPGSRVKMTAEVGEGTPPPSVIHAMMLLIGAWYENREQTAIGVSVSELPGTVAVDALLCNDRRGN